jgi:hypothetical protein
MRGCSWALGADVRIEPERFERTGAWIDQIQCELVIVQCRFTNQYRHAWMASQFLSNRISCWCTTRELTKTVECISHIQDEIFPSWSTSHRFVKSNFCFSFWIDPIKLVLPGLAIRMVDQKLLGFMPAMESHQSLGLSNWIRWLNFHILLDTLIQKISWILKRSSWCFWCPLMILTFLEISSHVRSPANHRKAHLCHARFSLVRVMGILTGNQDPISWFRIFWPACLSSI